MENTMTFNVNDYVFVKLTEYGKKALDRKARMRNVLMEMQGIHSVFELYPESTEFPGYYRFQMWELMSIFGEHCFNGAELVFETEIKLTSKTA